MCVPHDALCRCGLWLATPTCWRMMRSCGKRNSLLTWRSCWALCVTHWLIALNITRTPLLSPGTKPWWCPTAFPIMLQYRCTTTGRRKPGNGSFIFKLFPYYLWMSCTFTLCIYFSFCGNPGSINKKKQDRKAFVLACQSFCLSLRKLYYNNCSNV